MKEFGPVMAEIWKTWGDTVSYPGGPISPLFLIESFQKLIDNGTGRAYGLFSQDYPAGILLGMLVPDMMTGRLQGVEYLWAVDPAHRGIPSLQLLRRFEQDCADSHCEGIVAGFRDRSNDLEKIYDRRGYVPYGKSFFKAL